MPTLLRLAPTEIMEWQKLCRENPSETPASCLERVARGGGNAGATSTAPRVTPVGDQGGGEASRLETVKVVGKRKDGCADKVVIKRVKVVVDDQEASRLVSRMHGCMLEMVNSHLPGVVAGLPEKQKEWAAYRESNGGDFTKGSLLSNLQRANGTKPRLMYSDHRVREWLVARDAAFAERFFGVFPTVAVLHGRMEKLKLPWAAWW